MYDTSLVSALIAAGCFKNPLMKVQILYIQQLINQCGATEIDYSYEREQRIGRYNSPYGERCIGF